MPVYTLGPEGTYSHQAAISYFPSQEINFLPNLADIFEKVSSDENNLAVVPLENMIEGTVRETLDLLYETEVKIYDIYELNINHAIISKTQHFKQIISHPQALAQCRKFIRKNYPGIQNLTVSSTAEAALHASQTVNLAAIASPFAAKKYDLEIIDKNISDYKNNKTRFAILSQKMSSDTYTSTSIAITPIKDEPGLLVKILQPFHENEINLTKIESRPEKTELNNYIFFLDLMADHRQAKVRKIFTHLEKDLKICEIKVLGGKI